MKEKLKKLLIFKFFRPPYRELKDAIRDGGWFICYKKFKVENGKPAWVDAKIDLDTWARRCGFDDIFDVVKYIQDKDIANLIRQLAINNQNYT